MSTINSCTASPSLSQSSGSITSSPSKGSPKLLSARDVQLLTPEQTTQAALDFLSEKPLVFVFEEPQSQIALPPATRDSTKPSQSSQPQKKYINLDKLYEKCEEESLWPTIKIVAGLAGAVFGLNYFFGTPVSEEFLEVLQKPDMF